MSIFVLQLLRAKTRCSDHGGQKPSTPFESTIQGLQKLTPWFSFYFNSFTVKNAFKFGSQKSPIGFHANLNFGVLVLSQFERYRLGAYIHR